MKTDPERDDRAPRSQHFVSGTNPDPMYFGGSRDWHIGTINPVLHHEVGPPKRKVLPPDAELTSSQTTWSPEAVSKYMGKRSSRKTAGGEPHVFDDGSGSLTVTDGHHRLLADRRLGQKTTVRVYRAK